jgi:DNA ligase D-like protein (predicted polymerase)
MAKAAPAVELDVDGQVVRVTNPDKVYFPELGVEGGRKLDLVQHYVAVGPGVLRALHDRPTYLQRFPEGVEGEEVYQKRFPPYAPDWIQRVDVTFPSGRTAAAMRTTSVADVAWAANLGTVTFHPWPSRAADPDHPDELRLDLDPHGATTFDDARTAALEVVRPVLADLGYTGFVKTSGSRGVHVLVRVEPRWDFIAVRRCAIALAREVERRSSDRVTTAWWKEERGDRVFIDFNQTARDRTVAGAYSARARPRGTVSAPVTWDELVDVDPQDLTIRTMGTRFADVGDPHEQIDDQAFSLEPLLEQVQRDEAAGLGDMPYPPSYPKMPGEPPRVQPSKKNAANWTDDGQRLGS